MSIESTRAVIARYLDSNHGDFGMMASDVVFTIMATGQEHRGRVGVSQMLNHFYRIAFDAVAEPTNVIVSDGKAVFEGTFVGRHLAEFAGIPATHRRVRVPLCVVYDLVNDEIKRGRIYFETPALLRQLAPDAAPTTR